MKQVQLVVLFEELNKCKEGDEVESGKLVPGITNDSVVWKILKKENGKIKFKASWLGLHLSTYGLSKKGNTVTLEELLY